MKMVVSTIMVYRGGPAEIVGVGRANLINSPVEVQKYEQPYQMKHRAVKSSSLSPVMSVFIIFFT